MRRIPISTLARVIVDNDFAGDPDGLVALAHQLLTESTDVRVVCGTSLEPPHGLPGGGRGAARAVAEELIDRLAPVRRPLVTEDTSDRFADLAELPAGAAAIVEEANRASDLPLFVTCGGPLTNVAAALRADPSIAERMTVAWIGGGDHPAGGWEYNLALDPEAAQFVFNASRVPVIQFPVGAYRQCAFSVAELELVLADAGEFGSWLYDHFTTPPEMIRIGDSWPMGDSPVILATALGVESSRWRSVPMPWIADDLSYEDHPDPRDLVVCELVDTRLLLGDFAARLRLHTRIP
ncbi:nucleoside hydrolase [Agromyces sp. NPDC057865]|uniref:nucleoside hydrolase n=1 Tax=Agromyces sp. NPDC057865 TaxID=3346267 RepID=UPI00366A61A8